MLMMVITDLTLSMSRSQVKQNIWKASKKIYICIYSIETCKKYWDLVNSYCVLLIFTKKAQYNLRVILETRWEVAPVWHLCCGVYSALQYSAVHYIQHSTQYTVLSIGSQFPRCSPALSKLSLSWNLRPPDFKVRHILCGDLENTERERVELCKDVTDSRNVNVTIIVSKVKTYRFGE